MIGFAVRFNVFFLTRHSDLITFGGHVVFDMSSGARGFDSSDVYNESAVLLSLLLLIALFLNC